MIIIATLCEIAINTTAFFSGSYICSECALERYSKDIFWITFNKYEENKLSLFIKANKLKEKHEHNFLLAQGGGGPIKCAIGNGRHIMKYANYPPTIYFFQQLIKHEGIKTTKKYISIFLSPTCNRNTFDFAFSCSPESIIKYGGFRNWFKKRQAFYKELLEDNKEN